jgi:hypothetical protein
MKLTQWFSGDVKPVHIGVYERRLKFTTDVYYSLWDGENWQWLYWTVKDAAASAGAPSAFQNLPWRGVLK